MSAWEELGDRTWVRRYPEYDVNVGLVVGSEGALVVDTRADLEQAQQLLADIGEVTELPVRWVVNTHAHFDHVFGNPAFKDGSSTGAKSYAQENTAAAVAETVAIDISFSVAKVIELGDRRVELLHLGNGHTDGDVVVVVPDVDVFFAGDMIEESAPPSYGEDSYPLQWADTVDRLIGLLTATSKVVPGHGAVVDAEFVRDQNSDIGTVANTISGLHHNGTSLEAALAHTDDWPWPQAHLEQAVRRGYAALGAPPRPTLPLLGLAKDE